MSILDTFNSNEQSTDGHNPSTLDYVPLPNGWSPPSSRTLYNISFLNMFIPGIAALYLPFAPAASSGSGILTYTFSSAQSLQFLQNLVFSGSFLSPGSLGGTIIINITVFADGFKMGSLVQTVTNPETPLDLTIDIINQPVSLVNQLIFNITINGPFSPEGADFSYNFGPLSSTFLCVARGSLILTRKGERRVEELQRGEEILNGEGSSLPLARLIRQELVAHQEVEVVIFSPSSLAPQVPTIRTLVCAEHYFIHQGQRWLAKSFLPFPGVELKKTQARNILPADEEGHYYMYDLQFDEESSYWVNGLLSQSRSPYAQISPLPEELYFQPEKYKEIRVANTLTEDPPIKWAYLCPDGREIPSKRKEK